MYDKSAHSQSNARILVVYNNDRNMLLKTGFRKQGPAFKISRSTNYNEHISN